MSPFADVSVPTFGSVVAKHAAERPDAIAVRFEDREWSYSAFDAHAFRIAHALRRHGVEPGDRVCYLGRNSDLAALLALGTTRASAIFVPVNWRLAQAEVERILEDAAPSIVFAEQGYTAPSSYDVQNVTRLLDDKWLGDLSFVHGAVDPGQTAIMIYTSGTTGVPKGVMLSHRSLFGSSVLRQRHAVEWDDWGPDDVSLVASPMAHVSGIGFLLRTLFFGGEAVILSTLDTDLILDAIEQRGVSKLGLVPTAIKMVMDNPRSRSIDYSRLGTIVYGASPITLELLREAIGVFKCRFAQSYGMSETSGTCVALPPHDHDVNGTPRMRSAGRALPGTEICIIGKQGQALPPGSTGEIALRTVAMMNSYWRMPEATANVLDSEGWYRTGDAGYIDEDGYLFIKDRLKDMIVSGAENIYPAEVENVLAEHPDIDQVAVIGVPDQHWGEVVKAVVVPVRGRTIDEAALIAWSKDRIAAYKAPKSIDFLDQLPLTTTGKVQKIELRARYWEDAERQIN